MHKVCNTNHYEPMFVYSCIYRNKALPVPQHYVRCLQPNAVHSNNSFINIRDFWDVVLNNCNITKANSRFHPFFVIPDEVVLKNVFLSLDLNSSYISGGEELLL